MNRVALAAPIITGAQTTANVAGVSEVKATRTLTVVSLPANAVTLTIGLCVVTFSTTAGSTANELNCGDNVAAIDRDTGAGDTPTTPTEVGTALRALTNVSDTGHGALTVGGSSLTASYTTTGTENTAAVITASLSAGSAITLTTVNTTGVIPVTAVARVATFTPSNIGVDYIYTVTIDSVDYSYTHRTGTLKTIVEGLVSALGSGSAVSCTEDDTVVTCTAAVAGTTFTFDTSVAATAVINGTSSSGGSSGGGGGGGSRYVAPVMNLTTPAGIAAANELRIEGIKKQINAILQLIQRLQFKLSRMQ